MELLGRPLLTSKALAGVLMLMDALYLTDSYIAYLPRSLG